MWDWVEVIAQKSVYMAERGIAQLTWGFDRSGLSVIAMLDQFRHGLVTRGFTAALDEVAHNVMGVSRPVFELALVLGCLLVIASPLVRFQWVNMRKAIVLALLLPVLFPWVAAQFQTIDGARGDMADTFYNHLVGSVDFGMGGDGGGNGAANDMGPVVPFAPPAEGRPSLRGVDVAAAYLFATRDDVQQSRELPAGFEQRYFPMTVGAVGNAESEARWAAVAEGANGITRTLYGGVLVAFAFFEAVTNLGFTVALGFLLIALLIAALFAFFTPFEGMFTTVVKKVAELFMQSWAISALQALLLAAVIQVGSTSGGTMTLGIGVIALFLQGIFMMMAWKTVAGSLTGFGMGGGLSGFAIGRAFRPATALASGAVGGVLGAAGVAPKAAMAYGAAKRQGASTAFATGYALNASRPLAAVGALATAMGFGGGEFAAGGAQAQSARHRGQGVTSALGLHGVQQHVERRADRTERQQDRTAAQARLQTQEQRYQASEARRVAQEPQREADRAYHLQERQRREDAHGARVAREQREAPIRAVGPAQIADQMVHAYTTAQMHDATKPARADVVTDGLGLEPGAFGRSTGAVQTVLNDLQQTPFAPDLATRMIREASQEGRFREDTYDTAIADLTASGMTTFEAERQVGMLQSHMQKVPTSVRVDDADRAEALAANPGAYAGYRAAHQARPQPPTTDMSTIRRPPTTMTVRQRGGAPRSAALPAPGLPAPGLPAPGLPAPGGPRRGGPRPGLPAPSDHRPED